MRPGVVGRRGAISIIGESLRQRTHVAGAEADDDAGIVEILGCHVDQADLTADLAGGGDDELEQAASRCLRFRAGVESRFLAHDRQNQRRIGAEVLRVLFDVIVEVARIEQPAQRDREQLGQIVIGH